MKFIHFTVCMLTAAFISSCDNNEDNKVEKFVLPTISNAGISLPYSVLGTGNGVEIRNGGFGSAAFAHPTNEGEFYAMTDRGPNADATGGKYFPIPNYTPRIGHFKLNNDGTITKLNEILFKTPTGTPISGRPNPAGYGATGEIPYDLNNTILDTDQYGLDSEGLVAMKDGSFWVSDEYGPHIVHYSDTGVELERISPVGITTGSRKLPAVFAKRWANRGMEGLAVTPDEKTLVGIMQSRLYNPSNAGAINKTLTRIVTFDIATGKTKQYLYKQELDNNSNSEICALSATQFLLVERDGNFSGDGVVMKHIYKIDISQATDVSGNDFNAENGLLVNGKALEANTWEELALANIKPVTKTLAVDVFKYLGNYPHDKLEGIWLINSNTIGIINDDDFGIWSDASNKIKAKTLSPSTGTERDGNRLYILKF
ncbi:esterase-like activity of phytase family protein [Flavobacterium agrisoli]|uniref:Esterase-like activity of phytase family protein n=1 Tax=Flavobacterium agrisoli TaxID=2793066 RepID=A0A934PIM3_9FLAO|nr:esterase-like activity of phytase family protein [Flavobacterium agrisoli]MBK0368786.1 esterase-like activity of phytase family protein [Flavobacterium agrisoli]